jgi:hypothetical protein
MTTRTASIPRYQPVALGRVAITDVHGDQTLGVTSSPIQKLPATPRRARRTVPDADRAAGWRPRAQADAAAAAPGPTTQASLGGERVDVLPIRCPAIRTAGFHGPRL